LIHLLNATCQPEDNLNARTALLRRLQIFFRKMAMSIHAAHLYKFLDCFVPPVLSRERDMRQRAHMFLLSHIFGPFLGNVISVACIFSIRIRVLR
jgi:hypothetical protein